MAIPKDIFEAFIAGCCIGITVCIVCMMVLATATGFMY